MNFTGTAYLQCIGLVAGDVCYTGQGKLENHKKLKWSLTSFDPCQCTRLMTVGERGNRLISDSIDEIRGILHAMNCELPGKNTAWKLKKQPVMNSVNHVLGLRRYQELVKQH